MRFPGHSSIAQRLFHFAFGVCASMILLSLVTGHELQSASLVSREDLQAIWAFIGNLNPTVAMVVILGLLFLAGCGLPLPEDIPLTFSGILLSIAAVQEHFGGFSATLMIIGSGTYLAILLGDLVAYGLGRRFGDALARWPFLRAALKPRRRKRMQRWFGKYGNWTVFLGRMVAGVRFVTFVSAGIAHMRLSRFILFDSLAALVTVPAWIFLGYMVGTHFDQILVWVSRINTTTWIVVGVLVIVFLVIHFMMKKKKREEETQE